MIVCAEMGINWEGDIKQLHEMIKKAAAAGVDAVKIQYLKPSRMYTGKAEYEINGDKVKIKDYLKKYQLNIPDVKKIYKLTQKLGIYLFCTVCDVKSVAQLEPFVNGFKVASSELNYNQLHQEIAKKRKAVFVSTGGAYAYEIEALKKLYINSELIICHSNYSYPAKLENVNLSKILKLVSLGYKPGFSSHVLDYTFLPSMAVMCGCRYYETHVTLERKKEGDHSFSLEFPELKELCLNVKKAKSIFGNFNADLTNEEKKQRTFCYRKAFAKNNIRKNHRIRKQDIIWLRNGDYNDFAGFDPKDEYLIIDKISKVDIKKDSKIKKEDLF